ncbi:hypothetical protein MD588_06200 [Photobacterium sp. SDRW27]|uniref:hypothetical protein n=1 Tax=Photobacterium obscurum TaxID=2829490 RepID=UPI002244040F|nr:hypothetical protein [Photobacterium obscurum]MCW8328396.1 hypothetical protein [Photobacterium obscurum]
MDSNSRENHIKQWVVVLTILAILLTNFLNSVVILNPSAYHGGKNWLTGEKVLICTNQGLKWIDISTLNQLHRNHSGKHETASTHHEMKFHCPILKHHQPLSSFPSTAIFFLLVVLSLIQNIRLNSREAVSERIYFSYAPKHSPPI